jgi:vacuolar-type H+-ATPase subunit E/Vma4
VFLTSHKSKIRVDNTLDKRLELLRQNSTPEIRKILFEKPDKS